MIFYNYGFNKHKTIISLKKESLIDGTIFNILNFNYEKGNKVIRKLASDGIKVIYDNPIYSSSQINIESKSSIERSLDKLLFNRSKLLDANIFDLISIKLDDYINLTKDLEADLVLGLPMDSILIKNPKYEDFIQNIPYAKYKYLSIMINSKDTQELLKEKLNIIKMVKDKFNIKKILITIWTSKYNQYITNEYINDFLELLKVNSFEITLHHNLNHFHLFPSIDNVGFGGFKQSNSTSADVSPFFEYSGIARTSPWFYSSKLITTLSSNKLTNNIGPFNEEEISNFNLNLLSDALKQWNETSIEMAPHTTVKSHINDACTAKSIKLVMSMSSKDIKSKINKVIEMSKNINSQYKKILKTLPNII